MIDTNEVSPSVSVSIIMPIFNAEAYLEETLSSFESQSFRSFELICIDDGSNDSSLEIVRQHALSDERIKIIQQENKGSGAARNRGLLLAHGEYLLFADADDVVHRDAIAILLNAAKEFNADICACDADCLDMRTGQRDQFIRYAKQYCNRAIKTSNVMAELFQIVNGYPWGKLFKASFVIEAGLRFQEISSHNDTLFVIGSYARSKTIAFLDRPLVVYRMGLKGSIQSNKAKHPLTLIEAVDALRSDLLCDGIIPPSGKESFDEYCIRAAFVSFESLTYDQSAAHKAYTAAKEVYLPKWGIANNGRKIPVSSLRLRFKLWCFARTSFKGYMGSRSAKEPNAKVNAFQKLRDGLYLLISAVLKR